MPPEQIQIPRAVMPPPATTTEYPPLPSPNRRSSGTGGGGHPHRGTQSFGAAPTVAGAAPRGAVCWQNLQSGGPEAVGTRSGNAAVHSNGDVSHQLEALWLAGEDTSPSRHSYRQAAVTAASQRHNELSVATSAAAAAAARAQAGLRRSDTQASVSPTRGAVRGAACWSSTLGGALDGSLEPGLRADTSRSRWGSGDAPGSGAGGTPTAAPVPGLPYGRQLSASFLAGHSVPEKEPLSPEFPCVAELLAVEPRNFALQEEEFPSREAAASPVKEAVSPHKL